MTSIVEHSDAQPTGLKCSNKVVWCSQIIFCLDLCWLAFKSTKLEPLFRKKSVSKIGFIKNVINMILYYYVLSKLIELIFDLKIDF